MGMISTVINMKHLEWCTHIQFKEDQDILTRANFNVNIRLLKCNDEYKELISQCVRYIILCALEEKEGYKEPHGWSGANAGIPFNIIALNDGSYYINPKVTKWSGISKIVMTNCGSLTLEEPVAEARDPLIDISYYDLDGTLKTWHNIGPTPGYTIQHEINHTRGFLLRNRPL